MARTRHRNTHRIVDRLYALGLTPDQVDGVATILAEELARQGREPVSLPSLPPARSVAVNSGVYFIGAELVHPTGAQFIKIGYSGDIANRLRQIQGGHGCAAPRVVKLETASILRTEAGGREREQDLHKMFERYRKGNTEWFSTGKDLLAYLGQ